MSECTAGVNTGQREDVKCTAGVNTLYIHRMLSWNSHTVQ